MNEILPVAPLYGTSHWGMVAVSLGLGGAFGFFLERAGFGTAKNLTSIFILRDFRVLRVMFSAVITAMLGTQLLSAVGLLELGLLEFDPNYFWPILAGGLVFGIGFYLGGYCPGTAAVALARGRWDSAAFLFGIVLGIYGFALLFDAMGQQPWFASFYAPAGAERQTLYGDSPSWPWVLGVTAVALAAFRLVPIIERRFALRTAKGERPEPPKISGWWLKAGPVLAGVAAVTIAAIQLVAPSPKVHREMAPAAVAVDPADAVSLEPLTLASWVVGEAHRRVADKLPPNAYVLDLRPAEARAKASIPGAMPLEGAEGAPGNRGANTLDRINSVVGPTERHKPVVLVDEHGADPTFTLARHLRRQGFNALVLHGGYAAWKQQVLETPEPLFAPAFAAPGVLPAGSSPLAEIDLAEINGRLKQWLAGRVGELPPRLAIPGASLLPAKAATVQAQGGGGGGCG